ncbi:FAD-binding protein [Nocardioides sp. zg-1228]|uniref:FAD-binding protein n=1 Tax=Nocardioides sp. zg-1228 TaxID=2763008 RepID=UPI001642EC7C|nr:FAD-binding protein [Nocardioides sp. zg-1228]MBC2934294.1 FAD-binding protein [Nocardioides sp. zg-1228]QSF59075.1 FAD-binding protein [Nocardioides sp. zg-1228]
MDNKSFDIVVVGTGTGMLAALAAAEAGMSVLLVEKSEYVGGSTALSGGGFWVPCNSMLAEAGAPDSMSQATEYLTAVTGGEAPEARWKSFLSHGAEAVNALRRLTPLKFGHMANYADYFPELPGGSAVGRAMEPKPFNARKLGTDRDKLRPPALEAPFPMPVTGSSYKWLNLVARTPRGIAVAARLLGMGVGGLAIRREYIAGGGALAAGLYAGVRDRNIPVWLDSPLKELLVEDDRVVGVVVHRDGKDISVRAKRGVILSAGGFDRNEAMRHAYQSEKLDTDWALGNPANTGDAITIAAQDVGADLAFMEEAWWFPAVPIPGPMPGTLLAERSLPGQIIVNQAGERFMNEAVNYMSAGKELLRQDLPVWMVFDQRYRNRYVFGGSIFPRQSFPQEWYDAGVVKKADSLEKLAAEMGMPALPQSVQRFNTLCATGHDDDFGRGDSAYDRYYGDPAVKPNPCLGPIDQGPFYAVKVVPGDLGTCGGVKADEFARALRPDGSVIEGLYAAGNAAGNAFGRVYPGPGATIAQGLVFGYIAANHAAGRLSD